LRVTGARRTQGIGRQPVCKRLAITTPVQAQAPAGLRFPGVLTAQGAQNDGAGITGVQAVKDVAGIGLLGFTEGIGEPFGRLGEAVGESRLGAYPDIQPTGGDSRVVRTDCRIKTVVVGFHDRQCFAVPMCCQNVVCRLLTAGALRDTEHG
jgi:hypothetical protein